MWLQGPVGRTVPSAFLVRPEAGQLRIGALADLAFVGPLSGVKPDVVAEGGGLAETAVAEAADEGFVQGVDPHVGTQVAAGVEAAVADDAAHAAHGVDPAFDQVEVLWGGGERKEEEE